MWIHPALLLALALLAAVVQAQLPGFPHGGGACTTEVRTLLLGAFWEKGAGRKVGPGCVVVLLYEPRLSLSLQDDCSLGGTCTNSQCVCDIWFTGPTCAYLNLQPPEDTEQGG
jgi:hypothetical protein